MLQAIGDLVEMAAAGRPAVRNPYSRSVSGSGNPVAVEVMYRVFRAGGCRLAWTRRGPEQRTGLS